MSCNGRFTVAKFIVFGIFRCFDMSCDETNDATNQVHLTAIENIHVSNVNYCCARNWIPLIGVIDATHRRASD